MHESRCGTDDVASAKTEQNLKAILARMKEAAQNKAELVIFPECSLQGYCYRDREEAWRWAKRSRGLSVRSWRKRQKSWDSPRSSASLNVTATICSTRHSSSAPAGCSGSSAKMHLLHLGVDRFNTLGDIPFPLFQAADCKFGVNICYDCSFPESGRAVKLKGAQLLAIPTNWPNTSDSWEHTPKVRATENHIFVVAADRVGEERGFTFAGSFADHRL